MASDPDDEDDEWRFSLSDIEEREDDGSDATESSDASDEDEDGESDSSGGLDAGVAGRMDVQEELEAQDIDVENALFVLFGVLLAIAFLAGFLNLLP
jgi:hypothetical protein